MASLEERFEKLNTNLGLTNMRVSKLEASFDDEKLNVPPETQKVYIDKNAYYQVLDDNFVRVFQKYFLKIAHKDNKDDVFVSIEVNYIMDFHVGGPMDDEIFGIFEQSTVLVDSWPYFRELVQNTLLRMGLAPIVIPPIHFNPSTVNPQQQGE